MLEGKVAKNRGLNVVSTIVLGVILYMAMMFVFSLVMWLSPITDQWMAFYSYGMLYIACLVCGVKAGYQGQSKGLIWGMLTAACIVCVLAVFYSMIFTGSGIVYENLWKPLACILLGGIGGILGANSK